MESLQTAAATILLSCCVFSLSGVKGQTILRSQSSGVVNVADVYVAGGSNLTNVFCYTDDGTVGFGITDSTSGQFQGVPIFNASDPPPPRVFFQKRLAAAPGFMFGYELNAHDYVGPQHIVGCSNDIVQARIVVGSRMGSIAHATSDNSIKGLAPGNYTFNESDTIPPIVCRAASGEPVDGSIHLNGTLFNGSSAVTMNPATDRQIIYYVPSMGGSSGVYTCTGFNQFNTPADTVRRVFRITIQFRPDFAGTVNRQIVHLGDQLVLSCRVSAFPELTNLNVLYPNDTRTDSLVADLSAGTSRDVRKVTFLDAPATAAHAGNYSCNGRNLVGASSQQIEVIVLGPPLDLSAASTDWRTVELNFSLPNNTNHPDVTGFEINCTPLNGDLPNVTDTSYNLSVIISNFSGGEQYTCSVRAQTTLGFGPAASVTVMVDSGSRPTAPQNLTAAVNHASPVVLNFAEGSPFVGEPVINYTVYCKGIELSHVFNTTTTSLAVNISKLYAGENYTCFVRAVNKISLGPAANISFALLAGPPCAPRVTQNDAALGLHLNILFPCDGGAKMFCSIVREQEGAEVHTFPDCKAGLITYTDSLIREDTYKYVLNVSNTFGSTMVKTAMLSAITPAPTNVSKPTTPPAATTTATTTTAAPPVTTTTSDMNITTSDSGHSANTLSVGIIAGIAVGVIILLAVLVLGALVLKKGGASGQPINSTGDANHKKPLKYMLSSSPSMDSFGSGAGKESQTKMN